MPDTPGPTLATSPADSWPGTTVPLPAPSPPTLGVPLYNDMSLRQRAEERTRMRTSPGPGTGVGRSATSTAAQPGSRTAFMVTPPLGCTTGRRGGSLDRSEREAGDETP